MSLDRPRPSLLMDDFPTPITRERRDNRILRTNRVKLIDTPIDFTPNILGIRVSDGKETTNLLLEYKEFGDPEGYPIIFNHGTPATIDNIGMEDEILREFGLRVIAYNRPGYGKSTLHKGRIVGDNATYAEAILKAKGITRCSVFGRSGGGPPALAQAVLLDEVVNVAVASGLTPPEANVDDEGWAESNVQAYGARSQKERSTRLEDFHRQQRNAQTSYALGIIIDDLESQMRQVDRDMVVDDNYGYLNIARIHAASLRGDGYIARNDDVEATNSPWGFDVTDLNKPTFLYYGSADTFTPPAHYEWFMKNLRSVPGGRLMGYLDPKMVISATGYREVGHFGTYLIGNEICETLKLSAERLERMSTINIVQGHRSDRHVASNEVRKVPTEEGKPDYWVSTIKLASTDHLPGPKFPLEDGYETLAFRRVREKEVVFDDDLGSKIIYEPGDSVVEFGIRSETREEAQRDHEKMLEMVVWEAAA
jgi:pimeloyl-ACP methyl ester carboxylesterase